MAVRANENDAIAIERRRRRMHPSNTFTRVQFFSGVHTALLDHRDWVKLTVPPWPRYARRACNCQRGRLCPGVIAGGGRSSGADLARVICTCNGAMAALLKPTARVSLVGPHRHRTCLLAGGVGAAPTLAVILER